MPPFPKGDTAKSEAAKSDAAKSDAAKSAAAKSAAAKSAAGIGSATWEKLICSGAEAFGIGVTADQIAQLTRFARILCDWNRKMNLTAITEPEEVAVKHFIDSMALLPFLPKAIRMLDIGSGGGFPGLVLAIFRPDLQITSIDTVRKKISFQQHIVRTLGLKGVNAIHIRAESLALPNGSSVANRYDIIVSRALGTLALFVDLAAPLLAPGGTMIAYKSSTNDGEKDEVDSRRAGSGSFGIDTHAYCLPKYGDRRTLVFIKPV